MASQAPGLIPVANETNASSSRVTQDGRRITYRMQVLQQPERARACGSGAKSSNDRRPVDPPPIIQLRVFEGPNCDRDITFQYNANFFLYATLENARNIAHGRVTNSAASLPVLTGTPVAGVAMLDRPEKAGYFIFPDLSVRHEGKYRLGFSLYEELKDPKDYDAEVAERLAATHNPQFSHRLEVKSREFNVYSAKKFPGLSNSTDLSRCFAEQGCRVRIRREVRMRRRDTKRDDYEEEFDHYERGRVSATPDAYNAPQVSTPIASGEAMDRPRSASNASNYQPHTRRPSMEQMHQPHQPYYSPQTPQNMYAGHQQYPPQSGSFMPPPPQSYGPTYSAPPPQPPMAYNYQYGSYPPPPQQYSAQHQPMQAPAPAPPQQFYEEKPQQPAPVAGSKRSYGSTFSTNAIEAPLHNGARPIATSTDPRYTVRQVSPVAVDSPFDDELSMPMSYRRADGSNRTRNQPAHFA